MNRERAEMWPPTASSDAGRPLEILHLEDDPSDAELVHAALESEGVPCRVQHVTNREAYLERLAAGNVDLILSDYGLPGFDGLSALRLARELSAQIPFIFVTGTMGEEVAIETLKNGATDYVLKHRLTRLGSAVQRAAAEAAGQKERERILWALHQERQFLRAILDNVSAAIAAWDGSGHLTWTNRALQKLYGFSEADLPRQQWDDHLELFDASDGKKLSRESSPLQRVMTGESVRNEEFVIRGAGAEPRMVVLSGQPISDKLGGRLGAVIAMHDVTDKKELEKKFTQAQKMEAIGRLAGGVAHDFNNLLTVIIGYLQLIQARGTSGEKLRDDLGEVLKAGERGAALTRQLLALSRQQALQPRVLDLNTSIAEMEKLLRRVLGADIALRTMPGPGLGTIKADPGQIEQVILNLAVNARDAMRTGGSITIETANVTLEASMSGSGGTVPAGDYVQLRITDTGHGMDSKTLSHIFEPFYTTKAPGEGTGLGLATVHGIVHQSGGLIEVDSEVNQGTSFKIYFPCCVSSAVTAKVEPRTAAAPGGTEQVLVIDDDASVRGVVCESLRRAGYRVAEAGTRDDALSVLEALRGAGQHADLILSDVVLRGMDAGTFNERLRSTDHVPAVVLMSGYAEVGGQAPVRSDVPFLQKPFSVDALLRMVRTTLDDQERLAA